MKEYLVLALAFIYSFEVQAVCIPKKSSPQLSFTLASYTPGSLDRICQNAVRRAEQWGFSAVSLVPAKAFDGHHVVSTGTVDAQEMHRCLDEIWKSGLNLVYQPHLESDWLLHPGNPNIWRAEFDYAPGDEYFDEAFGVFFKWLGEHRDALIKGERQIDIIVAAELEKSTTLYPAQWLQFVQNLKGRLMALNLHSQVRVGYNPNWWPKPSLTRNHCDDFRAFVGSLDFIAPSFYGDWSYMMAPDGTPRGHVQVDDLKADLMGRLTYYPDAQCSVPEFSKKYFSVGEFGVGGDFKHAEQDRQDLMDDPSYLERRRAVFSNVLAWARLQTDSRVPFSLNLWTKGVFDPVGLIPSTQTIPDGAITQMFKDYQAWRCN